MLKSIKHQYKLLLGILAIVFFSGCAPYYNTYAAPYYYHNAYTIRNYNVPMYHYPAPYYRSDLFLPYYP